MIKREIDKTVLINGLGTNLLVAPLSGVPNEIFDYAFTGEYLRYGALPQWLRELWYRVDSIKDVTTHLLSNSASWSMRDHALAIYLAVLAGFSAADFERYVRHPVRPTNTAQKEFLGYFRRWEYRERVNSFWQSMVLRNKFLTLRILQYNHIRCSRVRAVLGATSSFLVNKDIAESDIDNILDSLPLGTYVYKPLWGRWGAGIGAFTKYKSGAIRLHDHSVSTPEDFLTSLNVDSQHHLMIEDRLMNHSSLSNVCGENALCTIRVVTVRRSDNAVEPICAVIRYTRNNLLIDNWSAGGLACPIDLHSGVIGEPTKKRGTFELENQITPCGVTVPNWEEILTIASEAHRCFSEMHSIGWDIAMTDDGPVVIEGNDDWDVILPQQVCGIGLLSALEMRKD